MRRTGQRASSTKKSSALVARRNGNSWTALPSKTKTELCPGHGNSKTLSVFRFRFLTSGQLKLPPISQDLQNHAELLQKVHLTRNTDEKCSDCLSGAETRGHVRLFVIRLSRPFRAAELDGNRLQDPRGDGPEFVYQCRITGVLVIPADCRRSGTETRGIRTVEP